MKRPTGTSEALASAVNLQRTLLERAIRIKELEVEVKQLRELLEWLDRRGGLGLDVHERIQKTLRLGG